jgi:hypothetical protein
MQYSCTLVAPQNWWRRRVGPRHSLIHTHVFTVSVSTARTVPIRAIRRILHICQAWVLALKTLGLRTRIYTHVLTGSVVLQCPLLLFLVVFSFPLTTLSLSRSLISLSTLALGIPAMFLPPADAGSPVPPCLGHAAASHNSPPNPTPGRRAPLDSDRGPTNALLDRACGLLGDFIFNCMFFVSLRLMLVFI